jgi:hypothetical protein
MTALTAAAVPLATRREWIGPAVLAIGAVILVFPVGSAFPVGVPAC